MKTYLLITVLLFAVLSSLVHAEEGTRPRNDVAFTLGTPGLFNVTYTRSLSQKYGVRLTGGGHFLFSGHWVGGQAEIFSILKHNDNVTLDVSTGIGSIEANNDRDNGSLTYWSSMFNTRYRRFVIQIGVGWMIAHTDNVREGGVLGAQLGLILVRF